MARERQVLVSRSAKTGEFVLRPMGTFKGYGALATLSYCRSLPSSVDAAVLGTLVAEFLDRSGPTGLRIDDYHALPVDDESRRTAESLGLADERVAFAHAYVRHRQGQQSWVLIPQATVSASTFRSLEPVRISCANGVAALGEAVMNALGRSAPSARRGGPTSPALKRVHTRKRSTTRADES